MSDTFTIELKLPGSGLPMLAEVKAESEEAALANVPVEVRQHIIKIHHATLAEVRKTHPWKFARIK